MEEIAKMTSKRIRNVNSYIERNNQEAMHVRNRSTISALNDLMKDIALVKYRKTLDEVAKAMTRALESDQKWFIRCQELRAELAASETKLKIAMQLSEEDKGIIDTLKKELQNAWNIIEEMKIWNGNDAKQQCTDNGDVCGLDTARRTANDPTSEIMADDKYKFLNEIEKGKLQIFELEEELANKEKIIEELTNSLKLKSKELKDSFDENTKLRLTVAKSEMCINKLQNAKIMLNKKTQADIGLKHNQILEEQVTLKKELHDCSKKDEISLQKLKHFLKKNKVLSRNLQSVKNENVLMKLQLVEQTRILDLLSEKCCKFEEKDTKQSATIYQLKCLRDKYVCVIGKLEQKIHDMKKKRMMNN